MLIFLSYGKFINSLIFSETKKNEIKVFDIICGFIYLSFISLIINFFFALSLNINNIIFFLSIIFLIFIFKDKKQLKILCKLTLIIGSISFLIMVLDHSNRPDAGLYHLPFISVINENKIILGLSNLHFRFAHVSIVQYTSAIFNNFIFLDKGITIPISTILSASFLFFFLKFFKNKDNYFVLFSNFLITSFIVLKMSRYNDIGNDVVGHLFFFITIFFFIELISRKKYNFKDFFYLNLFVIFAFSNKLFLIFSFLFPIFYLIHFKKVEFIFNLKNLLLIFFIFSLLLKNVMISSCVAYPLEISCFKNLSWSSVDKKIHSNPSYKSIEGEAAVKGWSDLKDKANTNYKEFKSDFNWLSTWADKHLIYLITKLVPLFVIIFILILMVEIYEKPRDKIIKNKSLRSALCFSMLICSIGTIYWFLKYPLYRYGYSFFVSILILLPSYFIYLRYQETKKKKIINYLRYTLFIFLIFVSLKNFQRIYKNFDIKYVDYPWPKIYSYEKENLIQKNIEISIGQNLKIYNPIYRLCMYSQAPCTHYREVKNQIFAKKQGGYILILPKN